MAEWCHSFCHSSKYNSKSFHGCCDNRPVMSLVSEELCHFVNDIINLSSFKETSDFLKQIIIRKLFNLLLYIIKMCLIANMSDVKLSLKSGKIEHNEKVCWAQKLGYYAQGQGHNHVRCQIELKIWSE